MVSPKMQCRAQTVVLGASPKCLEMQGMMCRGLKMLGTNVRHLGFSSPEIPPGKKNNYNMHETYSNGISNI